LSKCHLQDTKNSPKRSTLFWNINKTIGGLGGNNTLSWPHLKMILSSTNTFAVNWKALKHLEIHNNKIKNLAFQASWTE
jgi:hypothetical protein